MRFFGCDPPCLQPQLSSKGEQSEYMKDACRMPGNKNKVAIYFFISKVERKIHKAKEHISSNAVTKGCAGLSGDNLCTVESRYARDLVGDEYAR